MNLKVEAKKEKCLKEQNKCKIYLELVLTRVSTKKLKDSKILSKPHSQLTQNSYFGTTLATLTCPES